VSAHGGNIESCKNGMTWHGMTWHDTARHGACSKNYLASVKQV